MSKEFDSALDCRLLFDGPTRTESSLILLRSKLAAIARRLGINDLKRENMLLVASELVSNNVKHAGGRGLVQVWQQPGGVLDLLSLDYGPGIQNLAQAEVDGYSSSSTLGKGLGAIRRLSDESYIYTQPAAPQIKKWSGTIMLARFHYRDEIEEICPGFNFGIFSRSLSDERYNGDRIYLHYKGRVLRWLHLDGLGHGEEAKAATADLGGYLDGHATPQTVMAMVDRQLVNTRGAVAVTGEIDLAKNQLSMLGVGDMHAHVYSREQIQHIAFAPGILGREHRKADLAESEFGKKNVVVTASDGIRRNWDTENFTGLFNQHPQLIAYALGNIMGRISDDQSIYVAGVE